MTDLDPELLIDKEDDSFGMYLLRRVMWLAYLGMALISLGWVWIGVQMLIALHGG